jgi:glycosyltransferase 2 family protein
LLRLAVVELFANQAIPTGGLGGSLMVVRGLTRRGVAPAIAVTALLLAALSYYAAYFLVVLLAFVLLWNSGDLILRGFTLWRPMLPGLVMIRREIMKPTKIGSIAVQAS